MKDLNKAIADKDKIYCEIIASHVNHDGRTKGITYPNEHAQFELLKTVYEKAGISINDIGYFEAHGTGTQAGDQAELKAAGKFFSNRKQKLIVGSVKTNIGHTEAAAGIAAVIKSILILKNKKIPATLHAEIKNPNIPFEKYNIKLAENDTVLSPVEDGKNYVGINSFGFGGSNAHIIVSDIPAPTDSKETYCGGSSACDITEIPVFSISAKNNNALYGIAGAYADAIQNGSLKNNTLREICACSATKRSDFAYRLSIIAENTQILAEKLNDFQCNRTDENIIYRHKNKKSKKCAVIFSGMGVQTADMGRELYNHFPVFKLWFDKCSDIYYRFSVISLKEYMMSEQKDDSYYNIEVLQPYNLAYQISLFKLVCRLGIQYDGFTGHSAGELAAFYCSGFVSLENIFRLAYSRGKWQNKLRGKGKMLVLGISGEDGSMICDEYKGRVSLAVINGDKSIVLSGEETALRNIEENMREQVFTKFLAGDIAYHSYQMDEIKEQFLLDTEYDEVDADGNKAETKYDLYSTVSGEKISASDYTNRYWWENIRNTVRFRDAVNVMKMDGYDSFIELGASLALKYYIDEAFGSQEYEYAVFQQKEGSQLNAVYRGLAGVYVSGMKIDWTVCFGRTNMIELPKYQWEYETFNNSIVYNSYIINQDTDAEYAILGQKMNLPVEAWESQINLYSHRWLGGHKISGECILPGAAYIGMIIESGIKSIKNLNISSPVILHRTQDIILNLTHLPGGKINIFFTGQDRAEWRECCSVEIGSEESTGGIFKADMNTPEISLDKESIYRILHEKSLHYSDGFKIIDTADIGGGFALCCIDVQIIPKLLPTAPTASIIYILWTQCFNQPL